MSTPAHNSYLEIQIRSKFRPFFPKIMGMLPPKHVSEAAPVCGLHVQNEHIRTL